MPLEKLTKREKTHQRILAAASRKFRADGFEGAGVDGLSKLAEVTSGAFYDHMGSKVEAFRKVISSGLGDVVASIKRIQAQAGGDWVEAFAHHYLAQADGPADCICVTASLTPDVARAGPEVQGEYAVGMERIIAAFADGLVGGSADERQQRARTAMATLIGALTMFRAGRTPTTNKADWIASLIEPVKMIAGEARSNSKT